MSIFGKVTLFEDKKCFCFVKMLLIGHCQGNGFIYPLKVIHICKRTGERQKLFLSVLNPVPRIKKCSLLHQVVSGVKQIMPKIFSWKFTHISISAGLYDNPVPRIKKCSLLHQVVSDVKNNNAKNFLVKIYPYKYKCRSLW